MLIPADGRFRDPLLPLGSTRSGQSGTRLSVRRTFSTASLCRLISSTLPGGRIDTPPVFLGPATIRRRPTTGTM